MNAPQANVRYVNLTRQVIYLLVALVVVLPYIIYRPLPFKASSRVQVVYDRIDALKPGSHVLLAFDYDASSKAELEPMSRALLTHCFKKRVVPVVMTHWANGIDLFKTICKTTAEESAKALKRPIESGKDWVFLGFRPGGNMLVLNMGEDLKGAFEKDIYGQATQTMPGLEGVRSLRDIDFAVEIAAGATVEGWIAYGSDRFGFPLAAGTTAVSAPDLYPFLQSKQLVGLLGGLRGAADYEQLVQSPGEATRGMPSQSAAHLLLIVLIIGANARMVLKRFARKPKD